MEENSMKKIKFEITMEVNENFIHEAKNWEHHAEYLLDLDSYPEIKSISDCKVTELENPMDNVKKLWKEFGETPMNPETECIEEEWHGFPAGTFREDIWHWFEETFNVSVAKDLMGL